MNFKNKEILKNALENFLGRKINLKKQLDEFKLFHNKYEDRDSLYIYSRTTNFDHFSPYYGEDLNNSKEQLDLLYTLKNNTIIFIENNVLNIKENKLLELNIRDRDLYLTWKIHFIEKFGNECNLIDCKKSFKINYHLLNTLLAENTIEETVIKVIGDIKKTN